MELVGADRVGVFLFKLINGHETGLDNLVLDIV
jgi:hypothetical protein